MPEIDYEKILREVLKNFLVCEGTDYLGLDGEPEQWKELSQGENEVLTRVRDQARGELDREHEARKR